MIAGSFFKANSIPKSDLIYMKHILHDWSDADCAKILRNVNAALEKGGTLVVVDAVLPEAGQPSAAAAPAFFIDMIMLGIGSKERTQAQWKTLLEAAGFVIHTITSSPAPNGQIIEAIKQ